MVTNDNVQIEGALEIKNATFIIFEEPKNETCCTIMGIKVNSAKSKNLLKKELVGQSEFFGFFIFLRMANEFLKFSN